MHLKKLLIYCFIPLLIGGIIYIGFRTESLLMFKWFKYIGIIDFIKLYRNLVNKIDLPEFLIFSFPNGLWTFSFLMFINITATNYIRKILLSFVIFITIGFEMFQGIKLIPGTFCFIDTLTNIFFIILSSKIYNKMRWQNETI